ncbi:AI-2E family transporter [Candidatus Saccharibacteria bacterium]|nr:AI-2E family transporter [Candidatus Saccharibacteria bacterium]
MKVQIAIDTRTFVRFWLVLLAFVLGIFAIYSAKSALVLILIALFLALALNTPVTHIAQRLPGKSRIGATAIAYVIVLAILAVVIFLVIPPIALQTGRFINSTPDLIDDLSKQWKEFGTFATQYNLQVQLSQMIESAKNSLQTFAVGFGQNILGGIGSFFATIFSSVLALTLAFFMLIEGPGWMRRIWELYTDEAKMQSHRRVFNKMYNVVTGYVIGQLTVSALGGVFSGLFVFLLSFIFPQVSANLAFPTVAIVFTLSLIPMFGATIAGLLVGLLLIANNLVAGIVYVVYFIIYQQIENNFISPAIQSKRLELSPLIVLGAVTIGTYVFGLAGGIISIPIAGIIKVLVEEYLDYRNEIHQENSKPLTKLVRKLKGENE